MAAEDRARWDRKHRARQAALSPWLVGAAGFLPDRGTALDLACGTGEAAVWLAERGLDVTAVDISDVALDKARARAEAEGVHVDWVAGDLDGWEPGERAWDVVLCLRFLDRALVPAIRRAVAPGGLLVTEVLTEAVSRRFGAAPGELLRAYVDWEVLRYEVHPRTAALVVRRPG
ncbi:MAG: class I SAM-dependent methyltransferase [Myxococcota bacterium]